MPPAYFTIRQNPLGSRVRKDKDYFSNKIITAPEREPLLFGPSDKTCPPQLLRRHERGLAKRPPEVWHFASKTALFKSCLQKRKQEPSLKGQLLFWSE